MSTCSILLLSSHPDSFCTHLHPVLHLCAYMSSRCLHCNTFPRVCVRLHFPSHCVSSFLFFPCPAVFATSFSVFYYEEKVNLSSLSQGFCFVYFSSFVFLFLQLTPTVVKACSQLRPVCSWLSMVPLLFSSRGWCYNTEQKECNITFIHKAEDSCFDFIHLCYELFVLFVYYLYCYHYF